MATTTTEEIAPGEDRICTSPTEMSWGAPTEAILSSSVSRVSRRTRGPSLSRQSTDTFIARGLSSEDRSETIASHSSGTTNSLAEIGLRRVSTSLAISSPTRNNSRPEPISSWDVAPGSPRRNESTTIAAQPPLTPLSSRPPTATTARGSTAERSQTGLRELFTNTVRACRASMTLARFSMACLTIVGVIWAIKSHSATEYGNLLQEMESCRDHPNNQYLQNTTLCMEMRNRGDYDIDRGSSRFHRRFVTTLLDNASPFKFDIGEAIRNMDPTHSLLLGYTMELIGVLGATYSMKSASDLHGDWGYGPRPCHIFMALIAFCYGLTAWSLREHDDWWPRWLWPLYHMDPRLDDWNRITIERNIIGCWEYLGCYLLAKAFSAIRSKLRPKPIRILDYSSGSVGYINEDVYYYGRRPVLIHYWIGHSSTRNTELTKIYSKIWERRPGEEKDIGPASWSRKDSGPRVRKLGTLIVVSLAMTVLLRQGLLGINDFLHSTQGIVTTPVKAASEDTYYVDIISLLREGVSPDPAAAHNFGEELKSQGKLSEALASFQEAAERYEEEVMAVRLKQLFSIRALASVLEEQEQYDMARQRWEHVAWAYEHELLMDPGTTGSVLVKLAETYSFLKRHEDEELTLRNALKYFDQDREHQEYNRMVAKRRLAFALHEQGKYDDAELLCREILAWDVKEFGFDHPNTLLTMANLATTLREVWRYEEADQIGRLTLQGHERVFGNRNIDTLLDTYEQGRISLGLDQPDLASMYFQQACDGFKDLLGEDDSRTKYHCSFSEQAIGNGTKLQEATSNEE